MNVLFIEDDRFWARSYVEELQTYGFDVVFKASAEGAIEYLESHSAVDAIVLDVMMPTPEGVAQSETSDGQSTGVWLLKQIADLILTHRIPVWILTNRDANQLRETINAFGDDFSQLVTVDSKLDVRSYLLPPYLKGRIEKAREVGLDTESDVPPTNLTDD